MTGLITDYVAQGLLADRPAAPAAPDSTLSFYFAQDNEKLYLYNWGVPAWEEVTGGGGGGSTPWYWAPPAASEFPTFLSSVGNLTLTDDSNTGLHVASPAFPSGLNTAMAVRATPAGSWTAVIRMGGALTPQEYLGLGLAVRRSASGAFYTIGNRTYGSTLNFMINRWNSLTSFNSDVVAFPIQGFPTIPWLKIEYDSGTGGLSFSISTEGKFWQSVFSENQSVLLGGAPDQIGLFTGSTVAGGFAIGNVEHWDI